MTKLKILFFFVSVLNILGCTPYQMTLTNEERSYPTTASEKVQLFFQGETTPPAKEIGNIVVFTHSEPEEEDVQYLKEKAASMGADAITNVEVKIQTQVFFILIIPIPIHSYHVSGTAIKYNN